MSSSSLRDVFSTASGQSAARPLRPLSVYGFNIDLAYRLRNGKVAASTRLDALNAHRV
jgi:hypothetical protein